MPHAFIDTLHDPAVRDLAWVIGSPGLVEASHAAYLGRVVDDSWCSLQLQSCAPWLAALDRAPLPLHDFIAARPTRRLGHYFESLIAYWLMRIPGLQMIARNLQVQHEQRTLGEYDFLFRDVAGAVCHWEAAVKFYLQLEPLAQQQAFIGPGARDRLDLKLDRVFHHQLQLGNTPAGQQVLPAGIRPDKTQAFIKGYLFYHASEFYRTAVQGVSPCHLSGWWVRHARESIPGASAESRWISVPRMRWLAPLLLEKNTRVLTDVSLASMLDEHFNNSNEAIMVFEITASATGAWQEKSRGFVVSGTWPLLGGGTGAQALL